MPYRAINHTGDFGIEVQAESLEALFQEAAMGFTDIITEVSSVEPKEKREVTVEGHDREQLLVRFLSELLFLFDTEQFLCRKCTIQELSDTELTTVVNGETFDPEKHEWKTEVKAVTYHGLKIEQKDNGYTATIIFDL